ncbi:probable acyl-activating enzyme 1, peroxisomal isoform X2 [Neltuma alba]|uniref:probable acyl-activating enzyme 1, peroxisomal isoform X2 n=1 Tax=Neltuma alba TaxID=207710 RepID=UPI0010A2E8EC|nr:probable acyl-activating enzyme 1, peroxisomal isoform X2 [Prosopis alba]
MQKRELGSEVREMMTSLQLLNINSWASGFNMNRNRTFCKPRRQASRLHVRSKHSHFDSAAEEGGSGCTNYGPLSPISFLERAANFSAHTTSIVYGNSKFHWALTHQRCLKLASALSRLGVSRGHLVATLLPNVPAMYELHFAVPMAGAILCTLNSRLDGAMVSVLLEHSQAKVLFVDYQLLEVARRALNLLSKRVRNLPILVLITDSDGSSTIDTSSVSYEYEELLSTGSSGFEIVRPNSEFDPISVNYTSGTTSRPKGVVFSHRGAYLNTLGTILLFGMGFMPVYLWTVPMFHCNGWCLPWGVAAQCGTNVCLRKVSPKDIFEKVTEHKVTHMGGAPTVLNMIVNSALTDRRPLTHKVVVVTGGAPPPPQILSKMEEIGFSVSHLYGLTETYGPGTSCEWRPEWDSVAPEEKYKRKARQGIPHVTMDAIDIKDPDTMKSVPADGKTMGEVMFRGNTVMSGYLRDSEATEEAFRGGWFHSGDVGVKHSDGYIEIKDRLKDIIISGGENISSVEVETVLYSHPAVLEAAVVARPDDHWGQTPCAFVSLKEGFSADAQEIIDFCRDHLPHYMAPKTVIFEDLPKTATGKIQKFVLREKAKAMGSLT